MVIHTIPDKSNTIINDSMMNYGLLPVSMLFYGNVRSRVLLHFNVDDLKPCCDKVSYTHHLKMVNCGSINPENISKFQSERAVSFDIMAVKVSDLWDEGIGFDNLESVWVTGKGRTSTEGSNWKQPKNGHQWSANGFMNDNFIATEWQKFINGQDSAIIATQHFDHGNEDLDIDITKYVNEITSATGTTPSNYGICLMFTPDFEDVNRETTQYVGFFNEKTNTMYTPFVETRSNDYIRDDRFNFIKKKENRLYLYIQNDGIYFDLDEMPTCSIGDDEYEVVHQEKGIYYAIIDDPAKYCSDENFYNDLWGNVKVDGEHLDDVELEFYACDKRSFIGSSTPPTNYEPMIYGVNDNEEITRGQIRRVNVRYRIPYDKSFTFLNDTYYRIYIKELDRERTIVDWDGINNVGDNNYFDLRSDDFTAGTYYVDIKMVRNGEKKIFKEKLKFKIPSDTTNIKR